MTEPAYNIIATFPRVGCAPFSAAEFARRQITPRPQLVEDWVPGNQVSSIDGDGGAGKSTVGLQLAVAVVSGRSWLGMPTARGPALYLSAEDDEEEVHRRLHNITAHAGLTLNDLADLHVWPLAEADPALVLPNGDALQQTPRWQEMEAVVARIRPVLLVLDSRADVFGGNEISRSQTRAFVGMLRGLAVRNKLAVVLLAHPSLSGMASGTGSSGSTHWRNAVRSALYLTRPDDGETADLDARTLSVKKSNYGPAGLSLRLRWTIGGFVVDGEGGGPIDRTAAIDAIDRAFLHLLTAYQAQGRTVSDRSGHGYAPAMFAKDPLAKGATKQGLTAAMNRLFAAGDITVETVGAPSRQSRSIVRNVPK